MFGHLLSIRLNLQVKKENQAEKDLRPGQQLPFFDLLIFPQGDGNGIRNLLLGQLAYLCAGKKNVP
ncbi:MAG TPA: hypothetical protein H9680_06160 [Firmicutes bacterium]|nr:hypothetical protein [Bacillota bacterium]